MPEATVCQELQLRERDCDECEEDRVARIEAPVKKFQPLPGEICDFPQCPAKAATCPDGLIIPGRAQRESASIDHSRDLRKLEILRHEDKLFPGPLGPYPETKDESVPTEYWAPLADFTHTRPAVESLTVTRYSPAEWRLLNNRNFNVSNESVNRARLAAINAERCMNRVYSQTDKDQQDNNVRLNARLGLVDRWKIELKRDIDEFTIEVNLLQEESKRLARCMHALNMIEAIDKDVKKVRCFRMEYELVRDEIEDEVSNEVDLCADIANVYTRFADQVKSQIQELKDAKRRLEIDLADKHDAYDIDVVCRSLDHKSPTVEWKPGSVQVQANQSTPASYEHYCKESIAMGKTALQRSKILRLNLHDTYDRSVKELRAQANKIDVALARKIDETDKDCRKLENELTRCLQALSDAEALVEEARAATKRLDGAMKCAQTRLDLRSHRAKVENCRDIPLFGLIDQVKTLSEGVSAMLSQMNVAERSIDELGKARGDLEKNIVIKRKSLWVDRDRCQLLRSFYPTVPMLAGH